MFKRSKNVLIVFQKCSESVLRFVLPKLRALSVSRTLRERFENIFSSCHLRTHLEHFENSFNANWLCEILLYVYVHIHVIPNNWHIRLWARRRHRRIMWEIGLCEFWLGFMTIYVPSITKLKNSCKPPTFVVCSRLSFERQFKIYYCKHTCVCTCDILCKLFYNISGTRRTSRTPFWLPPKIFHRMK